MELDSLMDLEELLQTVYDEEINLEISWFWDAGFFIKIGDVNNGWYGEEWADNAVDIKSAILRLLEKNEPLVYKKIEAAMP